MTNNPESIDIAALVLVIRGQKVMLDRDLAALYGVKTGALNQAVRRNVERFPDDFMFELTRDEIGRISQSVISLKTIKFSKKITVFTEHGVAMLSSVLRSPRAIQINIQIMRTFSRLRDMVARTSDLARRLDELEQRYDGQFKVVFAALNQPELEELRKPIGFIPPEP